MGPHPLGPQYLQKEGGGAEDFLGIRSAFVFVCTEKVKFIQRKDFVFSKFLFVSKTQFSQLNQDCLLLKLVFYVFHFIIHFCFFEIKVC